MSQATASQVTVLRADSTSSLESLNTITNAIRIRAAQIAQGSGGSGSGSTNTASSGSGSNSGNTSGSNDATSNWLQAERDLFNVPEATLTETDQNYNIAVVAAGCDAGNLEVIATANSVVVRSTGAGNRSTASTSGSIVYSDVDSRMLFRRFDLATSIDNTQVSASLDNGILTVNAMKATTGSRRSTAAKA